MSIEVRFVTRERANRAVTAWHSHHCAVRSDYFRCGAFIADELVGVGILGRPNAPALCDGKTAEVLRVACVGGHANVASRILGSLWGAAKALGFTRCVSYTRADEDGTSYKAAGWVATHRVKGREWGHDSKPGRWLPGLFEATTETVDRIRWEIGPAAAPALARTRPVVTEGVLVQ